MHSLGTQFLTSLYRPAGINYLSSSYSSSSINKKGLNHITTQHPGMEKAIMLLAILASKKNVRIVLADDDADDRDLFEEAITKLNAKITFDTVEDGVQLMELLNGEKNVPDIVFLDLNMPGKNGKKCLEEIRANEKFKNMPVVIYSTSSSIKDIDDTYNMGANLYIRKPNSFNDLVAVTKKVFSLDWNEYQPNSVKKNFVLNFKSFLF